MKFFLESEAGMRRLGAQIGRACKGGECLELIGDVGAGKTAFTKGLGVGLGVDDEIQSPTFTISRTYTARDDLELMHYDFYRLHDAGIMALELQEAIADEKIVTVIEWSKIVEGVLKDDRLRIEIIASSENGRKAIFTAGGPQSQALLERVK